jgi:hypothetical protein
MRHKSWSRLALVLALLGLAALLAGCGSSGTRLRIANSGATPIEGLMVLFPDEEISFGDVPGGTTTEYVVFLRGVYRYAAYRFILNGEQVTQPVIDWVGEEPMEGEAFTYVVEFNPGRPAMQAVELLDVIRDE